MKTAKKLKATNEIFINPISLLHTCMVCSTSKYRPYQSGYLGVLTYRRSKTTKCTPHHILCL